MRKQKRKEPNMQMVTISATLQNQQLYAKVIGDASIGNLDWAEGSRMLGRSLNGMPWDSVPYVQPGRTANYDFGLSELVYLLASTSLTLSGTSYGAFCPPT